MLIYVFRNLVLGPGYEMSQEYFKMADAEVDFLWSVLLVVNGEREEDKFACACCKVV